MENVCCVKLTFLSPPPYLDKGKAKVGAATKISNRAFPFFSFAFIGISQGHHGGCVVDLDRCPEWTLRSCTELVRTWCERF